MAKADGNSERRKPVGKLWEDYENGKVDISAITEELKHGTGYLSKIDTGKIDSDIFISINRLKSEKQYLIGKMHSSGKYEQLTGGERDSFDLAVKAVSVLYETIENSDSYIEQAKLAEKSADEFIKSSISKVAPPKATETPHTEQAVPQPHQAGRTRRRTPALRYTSTFKREVRSIQEGMDLNNPQLVQSRLRRPDRLLAACNLSSGYNAQSVPLDDYLDAMSYKDQLEGSRPTPRQGIISWLSEDIG